MRRLARHVSVGWRPPAAAPVVLPATSAGGPLAPGPQPRRRPTAGNSRRRGQCGRQRAGEGVTPVTEAEWLACTDPQKMLESLRRRGSERKLRLFACDACRQTLATVDDPLIRGAIDA